MNFQNILDIKSSRIYVDSILHNMQFKGGFSRTAHFRYASEMATVFFDLRIKISTRFSTKGSSLPPYKVDWKRMAWVGEVKSA